MADVGARVAIAAGVAAAALFEDRVVVRELGVLHDETACPRHGHAVACDARRVDAVEHIDAALHALDEAVRRANAHEVARLVLRQKRRRVLEHLVHELLRLADREAAYRVARQVHRRRLAGAPLAQVFVHTALHDAEEALVRGRHRLLATLEPADRALRRLLRVVVVGRIRHTFIERHDDVRAECHLDLHRDFRREELLRAVDVRAERHALLCDLAQIAEAEDLKPAAVRQDRAVPVHELVQAAGLADEIHARPQEEVVGVRQDDARAEIVQFVRRDALDGCLRADRHEDWCRETAVRRMDDARARSRALVLLDELICDCSQIKTSTFVFLIYWPWRAASSSRRACFISARSGVTPVQSAKAAAP